jgi:hypothetical protein
MSLTVKTRKAPGAVRVNVKLAPKVDPQRCVRTVKDFSCVPGVRSCIRTFPEETDKELSRLYLIEVDRSRLEELLQLLKKSSAVEYAEVSAPRKLIR